MHIQPSSPTTPQAGLSTSEISSLLVPVPLLALLLHMHSLLFTWPVSIPALRLTSSGKNFLAPPAHITSRSSSLLSPIVWFMRSSPSLYTDLYFSLFIPYRFFCFCFCFQLALHGIHDLCSLIRDQPTCPAVETQSLNLWTTKEVPISCCLISPPCSWTHEEEEEILYCFEVAPWVTNRADFHKYLLLERHLNRALIFQEAHHRTSLLH